jgi:hypothetical protein
MKQTGDYLSPKVLRHIQRALARKHQPKRGNSHMKTILIFIVLLTSTAVSAYNGRMYQVPGGSNWIVEDHMGNSTVIRQIPGTNDYMW